MIPYILKTLIFLGILCNSVPVVADVAAPNMTVHIPMRDGKELSADLYFPPNSTPDERYPCILIRLPAGRKTDPWRSLADMANHGYVVAIQDTRSAVDPEGKTLPYLSDGWGKLQDGYDTVEWLAKSSFTNGKIGTMGFSAAGITQLMLAPAAPPSLVCQYVGQAASSMYHHAIYPGGQLLKNQVEGWLGCYAKDAGVHACVVGAPLYNELWINLDAHARAAHVKTPILHYGGWYDTFLKGTIDSFCSYQNHGAEGAKGQQKLIVGPWNHYWPYDLSLGEFQTPENGRQAPLDISAKCWFDCHLKGNKNSIDSLPAVTYYVMGPFDGSSKAGNVWKHADTWPVPAREVSWFLTEQKTLTESKPLTGLLTYASDPNNPVPTIGGRNLFLPSGPKDQRPIEEREDVLVFTSAPLKQDMEVTGNLQAILYFSSDVSDTDVVVRLTDVYPDGKSILISDGIYRTSTNKTQKNSTSEASENTSNAIHELIVDLWSTSVVFAKGHSIRLSICGSNYPRYEKNLNVGIVGANTGKSRIAKHQIHMGKDTASKLVLPIVQ